jgi:hypothetical protein
VRCESLSDVGEILNQIHSLQPFLDRKSKFPFQDDRYTLCFPFRRLLHFQLLHITYYILTVDEAQKLVKTVHPRISAIHLQHMQRNLFGAS